MPPQPESARRPDRPSSLARVWTKLREVGPGYAAALLAARAIPARLFRVSRLVLLELDPRRAAPTRLAGARWAESADAERLAAFGHAPEALRARFRRGDRAFALEREGELLAYVWFHGRLHDEEEAGVRFALPDDEVWLFDAMVAPAHRGRGLYPELLRAAAGELARDGVARIWIASDAGNRNSLRAHGAAGARPAGRLFVLRLFGFTLLRDRGELRFAGPSSRSGPEVRPAPRGP